MREFKRLLLTDSCHMSSKHNENPQQKFPFSTSVRFVQSQTSEWKAQILQSICIIKKNETDGKDDDSVQKTSTTHRHYLII